MRVLFVNDVGFQYGAGLAQLRQIQSFLLMGWDVAALCWHSGEIESRIPLIPKNAAGQWLGITSFPYLHPDYGIPPDLIVETLVFEANIRYPDIVIVGNLHGAKWPIHLLSALKTLNCPVISYMHDCYWFTGRCAYPGNCERYYLSCNHECPTWQEYPVLEPHLIFEKWLLKRDLFCGSQGIPLATNSQWLKKLTEDAIIGANRISCVYLGLDSELFQPIDKSWARQLLGLPTDSFIVLGGAANVQDFRKGGHIFQELIEILKPNTSFLVFGAQSNKISGVYNTGLLRDYRKMHLVYSAADVFVNTSLEEAFGQTLCEASACALPIVAFDVGGVSEVARHGENARLVNEKNALALAKEVEFYRKDIETRLSYGRRGREIVEAEFTLQAQGERWMQYLGSFIDMTSNTFHGVVN